MRDVPISQPGGAAYPDDVGVWLARPYSVKQHRRRYTQMSEFGTELARLMATRGIGMRELARRAHYNAGHISNLRNGRARPSPELATDLDAALGADGSLAALVNVAGIADWRRGMHRVRDGGRRTSGGGQLWLVSGSLPRLPGKTCRRAFTSGRCVRSGHTGCIRRRGRAGAVARATRSTPCLVPCWPSALIAASSRIPGRTSVVGVVCAGQNAERTVGGHPGSTG